MLNRWLIAPLEEGLRTDLKAWLIPDSAYARLDNAYIFRGRLKKRLGSKYTGNSQLTSRLRINLGTTDGSGVFPASTSYAPGIKWKLGQQFSIGTEIFTVIDGSNTLQPMLTTGSAVGKFNTLNGNYTFTGAAATTTVWFYPAEPVMGLTQFEGGTVHNQVAYAFDTQFVYKNTGSYWTRDGSVLLTSNNYDFVWSYNYQGNEAKETILFCTNNKDPMFYYEGSIAIPAWTTSWKPQFIYNATPTKYCVNRAKIILPFKNMLLLLGVTESGLAGTENYEYKSRVRYSQPGSPIDVNAFMEPNQTQWQGGGYIDAPVQEEIMAAELIRDRCIVYFERSTWELAYTGNAAVPFIFQQVNTELGSESQFSSVPFDKFILNVGPNGIQSCNGINVDRIDDKIPNTVFDVRITNQGMQRVHGVRDYYTELVYWTMPTQDAPFALTYPNKMLVFNYKNGTWAMNDDCITCFGYFEQSSGPTWAEMTKKWYEYTDPWNSAVTMAQFRSVIAGNQHGFITVLTTDLSSNIGNMIVASATYTAATEQVALKIYDHSLTQGEFIRLDGMAGTTLSGIYKVAGINSTSEIVLENIMTDPGTYLGGGTAARVSRIDIQSKEWNPYKKENRAFHLAKIDFGVKNTQLPEGKTYGGQITVDYSPSHSDVSMLEDNVIGTGILETTPYPLDPLETRQRLLWHPIYFNGEGDAVQIRIYWTDEQMADPLISQQDFVLEGLVLYTQPTRVK